MSYESFIRNNLAKKVEPDLEQIFHQLQRALQDLETAKATLTVDTTWALTIAYHAMIRAGRALMFSQGYLPTAQQTHKTIVEFTGMMLGDHYHELIVKFNRLRRRRHHFIYDSENHIELKEAQDALRTAKMLIDQIFSVVKSIDRS